MKERFVEDLKDVKFEDWEFKIGVDGDRCYLQVGFWDHCAFSGTDEKSYQTGRKWMLSPHMTKSEVVQTAFKAVMTAVEHETRENFSYKGKKIFGPHYNVDVLAGLCGKKESLDLRPHMPAEPQLQAVS